MVKRFGNRMEQFVLSVDVMDDVTFEDLLKLIEGYVRDELDIRYFAILEEQAIDDGRGLRTFWSTREERPSYTLPPDEGAYSGHTAYAFGNDQPLWVVNRERKALQDTDEYGGGGEQSLTAIPRF